MKESERDRPFADGKMSARFSQLKQAGAGTTFISVKNPSSQGQATTIDLAPGATIGGVYKIIQLIGRGGMGEVYLARHETLGNKCALKVIPPEEVTELGWKRFQNEAKAVSGLVHINLVRVTDLGIHAGCLPYYAMDFVDGVNLSDWLAHNGPMPLKKVAETFMQVCDGIECAHRAGILHRDLKPANIMLVNGTSEQVAVKILDFGLAKLISQDRAKQSLTAIGDIFGSPSYMSPELCAGEKIDTRSDIYAVGCTMFECLTGHPPFDGHLASAVMFSQMESPPPTLASVVGPNKLPLSIEIIMAKLLRKNPAERYQSLSHLKADLELITTGRDLQPIVSASALAGLEGYDRSPKSRRLSAPLLAGGLVILLLAGSSLCYLYYAFEKDNARRKREQAATKNQLLLEDTMDDITMTTGGASTLDAPGRKEQAHAVEEAAKFLVFNLTRHGHFLDSSHEVFYFPHNTIIGAVKFDNQAPVQAIDKMAVPAGAAITFYQNISLRKQPYFLDMFRPTDLEGLEIVQTVPAKAIDKIAAWKNLKHLSFFNSLTKSLPAFEGTDESLLSDSDLPNIDDMSNLQSLGLCHGATGEAIRQMHLLFTLKSLRLKRVSEIEKILEILPSLDNLNEVWLVAEGTTDAQLESLIKMKNLQSLLIRRSKLTVASVDYFRRMKSLKHLTLDADWTSDEKAKMTAALPFVQFEKQIDSSFWHLSPPKSHSRK